MSRLQVDYFKARRRLARLWYIGSGAVILILAIHIILNRFDGEHSKALIWISPHILPILALITGVLITETDTSDKEKKIDKIIFKVCYGFSLLYVLLLITVFLSLPFTIVHSTPFETMKNIDAVLALFQATATGFLGVFFVKSNEVPSKKEQHDKLD